MKGKRKLLSTIGVRLGVFDHVLTMPSGSLIVFNYHRIRPDDPNFTTSFDEDVFGPTAQELRDQLRWLKKKARILCEREVIEILDSQEPPREGCALVTFDDGYKDNFELAYPILRELGMPATFFVPTDLVERRRVGWWDCIAYFIKKTKKDVIEFEGKRFLLEKKRKETIRFFLNRMASEECQVSSSLLDQLREICGISFPGSREQDEQLMTWEEIREMWRNGMTIGAHTHTHRVLARLDGEDKKRELTESKDILERELGCKVCSIAYPLGGKEHFTKHTCQLACESGYKLGFSFDDRINSWKTVDRYDIKRLASPRDLDLFKGATLLPHIFQ